MRAALVLALLAAGCAGPLGAAPHHDPAGIYRATQRQARGPTALPSPSPVRARTVMVRAFGGEILAPTGALLMDDHPDGPVVEAYLVPNLKEILFGRVTATLAARGLRVLRAYDPDTAPSAEVSSVLDLELEALELHRWKKSDLYDSGTPGIVDLARVRYRFAWRDLRGAGAEVEAAHDLALPSGGDDLSALGEVIADQVLRQLEGT
ncbi:MAG: hypothetical protein U1E65_04105 [Myxococcota bacterium]